MAKNDVELALTRLTTFLKANLNAQISSINAEKNDGITLSSVDSGAYHFQYLADKVELSDPFVIVEESDDPAVQANGPQTAITYNIAVWLILTDNGVDPDIVKRLFRYRRAIMDLFLANWDAALTGEKLKVMPSQVSPSFPMKSGFQARAVGVQVQFDIVG